MSSYMVAIQVVGAVSYNPIIPDDDNIIASEGKFTLLAQSPSVILFDPVIRSGIVRFEVNNERDLHGVGIADETEHGFKPAYPDILQLGQGTEELRQGFTICSQIMGTYLLDQLLK
ncbi:MAG: hypothetical protein EZS28_009856 [Streblomastix strix]|uniref:Uncharacterized protein n=1 Tax=Streblomastix strix TaxID=222440 RepID=A0A5J4WJD2_9EUKA|nr:MAG: hypothetical protein EZS28_009856 [Streblomastix strix]